MEPLETEAWAYRYRREFNLADDLATALIVLIDEEPCSLDHHGYCQAHGFLSEGGCGVAQAKAIVKEWRERRGFNA